MSKKIFGGGNDEAKKAQRAAAAEQAKQEQLMRNQAAIDQQNQANKVATVETGGTDTPDTMLEDMRRRKAKADMASQLGVM